MYCLHRRYILRIFLVLAFFASLGGFAVLTSSLTSASTTSLYATIIQGTLTISNPSLATISAVTLEGTSQSSTGSLGDISVIDNRGLGTGWSATVSVSDFTCCSGSRTISVSNLNLSPGSLKVISGKADGVKPGEDHVFLGTEDAATLMTALPGSGMGSYRVTPTITLSIPSDAYAGTYTATVTVTII